MVSKNMRANPATLLMLPRYNYNIRRGYSVTEYIEIGERWIKQALHDLQIAEKNLTINGFDSAAFYSHQSVEKLLKGLISLSGRPIPRSHDLEHLADLLGSPDEIISDMIDLMGDYQTSRYPDLNEIIPCEYYTETIAKDRVRKAHTIFSALYPEGIKE